MNSQTTGAAQRASVPIGSSVADSVREFADRLKVDDPALVCAFFDRARDGDEVLAALDTELAGIPRIACSTAGELHGGEGYIGGSLTGFALPKAAGFQASVVDLGDLTEFTAETAVELVRRAREGLGAVQDSSRCFAMLVVDGLSKREERIAYALQTALGGTPLVGGSSGDGLRFAATSILHNDSTSTNVSGVLALVHCERPFRLVKTQHFIATDTKVVVTEADPDQRVVTQLNAMPAAEEYAALVGVPVAELGPSVFARHPLLVKIAGSLHVRSIQRSEPDGSLYIYCAIDEGLVLTLGQGQSMVESLTTALDETYAAIGKPMLTIGFDCILRRLESAAFGLDDQLAEVFGRFNVTGFNTYGEQFGALHVNQTFTGVAIA